MKKFSIVLLPFFLYALNSWVETTASDFLDGWNESNIYVSFRADTMDQDSGAVEFVTRFDYNNDGFIDLIVSNRPTHADYVYIYWGSENGYDPANYTIYPTGSGANCQGVDFDLDNNTDLVICHYYAPPFDENNGMITVHRGTPQGPEISQWFHLPSSAQTEAVYVCDVNRDGYLDIIDGDYPSQGKFSIFWGSADGYSTANITTLSPQGSAVRHNFEVADFNKDGYYDIATVCYAGGKNYIYWGSSNGFSEGNKTDFSYGASTYGHGLSTADLDNNGYLDLVCTGMGNVRYSYIYYNSEAGFYGVDTLATGPCFGGSAVFDFNKDGYLDIIFFTGDTSETQPVGKPRIYYGTEEGFSDDNYEEVGARSYNLSGGFVADFNKDGNIDIFLDQWIKYDNSEVLWGPDFSQHSPLPCDQDHHSVFWEPGNRYTRKYEEYYYSNIFDGGEVKNWDAVKWIDDSCDVAYVLMDVRTGNTPEIDESWSDWYRLKGNGRCVPDSLNSRYIQYRAVLKYENPVKYPTLYRVELYYDPEIAIFPDVYDSLYPGEVRTYGLKVWNGGAASDSIEYSIESVKQNWVVNLISVSGDTLKDKNGNGLLEMDAIPPGDTVNLNFSIGVPIDEIGNTLDTVLVIAHSSNNTTVKDTAFIIIYILPAPNLLVLPDWEGYTYGGVPVDIGMKVINYGNYVENVNVAYYGKYPWEYYFITSDTLESQDSIFYNLGEVNIKDSVNFRFVLIPPIGTPSGTIDSGKVVCRGITEDTDTAHIITHVLKLEVKPDVIDTVYPGQTRRYTMSLKDCQLMDTVGLMVPGHADWNIIFTDENGNTVEDLDRDGVYELAVNRKDSIRFHLDAVVPYDAARGLWDTLNIIALWEEKPVVIDTGFISLLVLGAVEISVEPSQYDTIMSGDTSILNVAVKNKGVIYDSVRMEFLPENKNWHYIYLWGNREISTDDVVGPLDPFTGEESLRIISIPPANNGSIEGKIDTVLNTRVIVRGWSLADPGAVSACTLNIIFLPEIDVHNFPNPFYDKTTFVFSIPYDGHVSLSIYTRNGEFIKKITEDDFTGGIHVLNDRVWDGTNEWGRSVAPGLYVYVFSYNSSDGKIKKTIRKKAMKIRR